MQGLMLSQQLPAPFVGDLDGLHSTIAPTACPAHGTGTGELVDECDHQAWGNMKLCGDLTLRGRHSGVDDGEQPHLFVGQVEVLDAS